MVLLALTWQGSLKIELDKLRFADWFHRDVSDNFLSFCSKFDNLCKETAVESNELVSLFGPKCEFSREREGEF